MNNWIVIIMAAGMGVRMRSSLPKVVHKVAGIPVISHVLRAARSVEPSVVYIVVSPSHRKDFSELLDSGVSFIEQPIPLGTGDALAKAIEVLPISDDSILVLNGDIPLVREESVRALAALHTDRSAVLTALTALIPAESASSYGRLQRGARGKPISILGPAEIDVEDLAPVEINVGAYAIEGRWVRDEISNLKVRPSGEYYVTDLVGRAVGGGRRVEVLQVNDPGEGFGVNTKVELANAERVMQDRLRTYWMLEGVTMLDPSTTYIHSEVKIGSGVVIHPNTNLHGQTVIADECSVGPNATLTDSTVGAGSVIGASTVDCAWISDDVRVGPYCHLRTGAELHAGVRIGSHVEIKNSVIGEHTKIGHFSYIGDAVIGKQVNIGAGTVTCNFDGKTKNLTEIGDEALVGSDTMLVAPVRLGQGAITGAGSVVTSDVGDRETVLGVPARPFMSRQSMGDASAEMEGKETLG